MTAEQSLGLKLKVFLTLGGASEAEVWGGQHEAVCREEPSGSLPEHSRAGAAGGAAADTDAAGEEELMFTTTADVDQISEIYLRREQRPVEVKQWLEDFKFQQNQPKLDFCNNQVIEKLP